MDNKRKKFNTNRVAAYALSGVMLASVIPYNVFATNMTGTEKATIEAADKLGISSPKINGAVRAENTDALSSATYYNKANWENKIKDKSRWPVGDKQRLVRVTTSDPVEMNDIDYDGNFVDANGRTVLRMVYKEKGAAATAVWYRAIFNFGDLDQYIDYDKSYMVGVNTLGNEAKKGNLEPFNDRKERIVDLGVLRGDLTNQRKNLPINLVLKEGVTIKDLGQKNYIVQMRLADKKGERIYAYAPKGTSMDYSTYTKTTSVSLEDKVNRLFIKGGYQSDGKNATAQEFVMSEFIANPEQYKDEKNLGIIRTQYTGQRAGNAASPTTGGQPIAFTQAFDANLLKYLKADDKGNVAYVNVLENTRLKSKWSKNVGFKKDDFNITKDGKLAYLVIGTHDFQKDGVKKVEIPKHDQHTMIQGYYITAIDYVVDKSKFEDTFAGRDELSGGNKTRKLNYSMISGWTNPNTEGWVVYEKEYKDGYVANEGESFIIDTTTDPADKQIMLQIGNDDAVIRKQQGYYSYYITSDKGIETIERYADGIYKFDLREGATVKPGDKIKVYMPYAKDHDKPVNFLEIHNGTKLNEGGATLKLQKDRNINMHLYKEGKKGYYILKYTLADGTKAEKKFEPKGFWSFDNKDKVMDGGSNLVTLSTGGNFYINTKKLKPGEDIIVESYDEKGTKLEDQTSWFKYRELTKAQDTVKELTWTDSSDKSSILSINKSLYTPYQVLFTNDYADGTDDFYKDPKVLPASNDDFKKDTKEFVGYTKYDGGKVRTLYEEGKTGKLYAKVEADENEYDKDGNLVGKDVSKKITIPKSDIFDAQFAGDSKEYTAYEYKVDLTKMLPYHSDDKTETKLTLLKDMKFVSTASDGSSLPSDLYETRVRARVLFDANTGKLTEGDKQVDKVVKIAPDNVDFFDQKDYKPNGFEGANVKKDTGDKFPEAPKLEGKNFLGWVTEEGKKALGDKAVVTADDFNKLAKEQVFTNETPITKHLVVYAVYSEDVAVTFDANQGKFGDGKDTTNVKVEGGNVTKPADPTRVGYKFLGWAATKDAKEADANILNDVTSPKTVYAVWEKTAEELTLNNPTPVEVKDTKNLTSDEKGKVADAVIAANPTLTKAEITVADDGTVTVKTKDGKTGTLTPDKTVKQKEVQNNFNPPKEPVKVVDKTKLTPEEKQAVKNAIKEANSDRNFKDEDITVNDDGSVKINQAGKVGSFTPDQTVVQKDTILDLTAPDKTEVKDITNLTQTERDKVAAAVKEANKTKLSNDAVVTVDDKGNVTVTDGTKTGKLEGKDTVKPFDRAGKTLNDPAITPVGNLEKLNETEKTKVRDAVKAANPDLGFADNEIQVADDGTVTVPMGKNSDDTTKTQEIPASKTVRQVTDADKIIPLNVPEKTKVADKTNLTQEEKDKVKEAVKKANPDLPADAKITVGNDGSVTVVSGEGENQKVGELSQADTVEEMAIKAPAEPVKVADPSNLTEPEKKAVEDAVKKANPNLPEGATIEVGKDGTVTVKDKDGKELGKLTPDKTVKKADEAGTVVAPAEPVKVADPSNLTEPEKKAVEDAVKKANPDLPKDATIEVGKDGTVTVKDKDGKELGKLTPDKTVKKADEAGTVVAPAEPVKVADPSNLTEPEKKAVEDAVKKANPDLPKDAKVTVGNDGTVTVTDKDGKELGKLTPDKTVKKADEAGTVVAPAEPVKVADPSNLTEPEKKAVEDAVKKANPDLPKDAKVTVGNDGTVTVTDKDGKELGKLTPDKTVKKADEAGTVVAPAEPVKVADPSNLTEPEKKAVEDAVKKANPDLPKDATIEVGKDGTVTVKDKDGKELGKLTPDKTVKKADEAGTVVAPAEPVKVADPSNLTEPEKKAVEDAVKKANPDLPKDAKVTVGNDGTVTVTDKDGKELGKLTPDKTVKKADEAGTVVAPAEPVKVADPSNLTEPEKKAVEDAVKKANPDLPKDAKVTVGNDGTVTVTDKDGKELGKLTPDKTVKKADEAGTVVAPAEPVKVADPSNLTEPEKKAVEDAVKKANPDLPKDAKVTVGNDGTVTVTDKDGKELGKLTPDKTVKKADEAGTVVAPAEPVKVADPSNLTEPEKKAVEDAVKKANPDLPKDAKVTVGNDGTVTVTDKDGKEIGKLTPKQTVKAADTTPDNGKKTLLPTDDYQDTGIKAGDGVDSNDISAIDEDGSYVPVYVDNNGNIIVKPGKDVDGPIKVTINKDGKERVIFIDILGHSMGHDDNGYRPGYFDGSYNIPGIRYRDHKTPTHPVTVTVPEKTETGVKVRDTLWYIFHINEFEYEVVRNGVVTKRLMDVTPVLQNNRTMLPLRYVAEALQADVKWDAKTRTATFTKDGLTASIQIDSDEIVLSNGKTVKMDSKPLNINDRILVSVTNVANVFGLTNGNTKDKADQDIEWEQKDKSATIYIRR
ncbi:stalk domain-containing protein [Peptoniphilus genitalis]|uniref:Stalk domain-containing protein n=1 Tax=Peptoniphilus genitalis TaxID=3036303 RepID=A0ABY4TL82_9FIRM|nr:stalk domain-containing protein [Peptoniphilus sp. SAHP1]URN41106.1 stalk domain-containing protein [Peptoniphilus sp. SAHP1]